MKRQAIEEGAEVSPGERDDNSGGEQRTAAQTALSSFWTQLVGALGVGSQDFITKLAQNKVHCQLSSTSDNLQLIKLVISGRLGQNAETISSLIGWHIRSVAATLQSIQTDLDWSCWHLRRFSYDTKRPQMVQGETSESHRRKRPIWPVCFNSETGRTSKNHSASVYSPLGWQYWRTRSYCWCCCFWLII